MAPLAAQRALSVSAAAEGDRPNKGRWSSLRKTVVVLRLFRWETLDALSRELGVTPGKLAEWRDEALAAMQAGLQSRGPDHRDGVIHELKAKVGDQAMQIELLKRKIDILKNGLRSPPRWPSL
jgi:transposase